MDFLYWGYSEAEKNITVYDVVLSFLRKMVPGLWLTLVSVPNCLFLVLHIHISQRHASFVVINVIVPIVCMAFFSTLVFLIPVDSGERISYTISVLLTIAIFLTVMGEYVPKTSNPLPLLSYYLLAVLVTNVWIALCNICNHRMLQKEQGNIGSFWRFVTFCFVAKSCKTELFVGKQHLQKRTIRHWQHRNPEGKHSWKPNNTGWRNRQNNLCWREHHVEGRVSSIWQIMFYYFLLSLCCFNSFIPGCCYWKFMNKPS